MSHLSTTVRIEAPAAVVFDLIADPARSPEWQTLLAEMGDIAGRPGGIGSSFVGFYKVAGRKLASRFVVTAAERPRIFQVNGTTSGGWARWTTMLEPDGSGCTIEVRLEYELPGEIVGSLFGLLTGNWIEREFRRTAGGVLAVDSPRALFDVVETFEEAGIGNLVREYFSEPAALLAKKWTLRRTSHKAGPSDWHQDGSFMGRDIRSLDVWVALSHCGDDAPGIDVVGRRLDEIVERGTEGAHLKWTVGPGVVERVAEGKIVRPIFEPGDALIFDHMNLHCTAVDPAMTRDRYAIEAWFFAPSTYGAMTNSFSEDDDGKIPADQIPIAY